MGIDKHHNHDYDGGVPDIPLPTGDRYYAQDLGRDFNYLQDRIGQVLKELIGICPAIIGDPPTVVKGAGDTLDIGAGKGIVPYEVDIPNDSTVIPMTVTQADIDAVLVEWPLQNDLAIASATLDGATPNFVKISYAETNSATRARAKKAGSYPIERVPSYTILVSAAAPTAYELVLTSFTGNPGGPYTFSNATKTKSTKTFHKDAITYKGDAYTIRDDDDEIIVLTGAGANKIFTLPTLADNIGKRFMLINWDTTWELNIDGEGAETIEGMLDIDLPAYGNFIYVVAMATEWKILDEAITSQIIFHTYAAYGGVDVKIMQFTTIVQNIGNMFSENHVSGYNAGAEGLELTALKAGKYSCTYSCSINDASQSGLSLNSAQLATNMATIDAADRLVIGADNVAGYGAATTWVGDLYVNDVIRPHSNGVVSATAARNHLTFTYLGRG